MQDTILGSLARGGAAPDACPAFKRRKLLTVAAAVLVAFSILLTGLHMVSQRKARMREQTAVLASVAALPAHLAPTQLLVNYGSFMQAPLESEVKRLSMDAQNAALFLVQCTPFARAETSAIK